MLGMKWNKSTDQLAVIFPTKPEVDTKRSKAYLLLFACSLTRAVYLELLPNLSTDEFMRSLKQVIARRGKAEKIYSDNAKTFVAAAERIQKISKSEEVNDFLAKNNITWLFNLSKAPWWGGQYERLIGVVKQSLYKVIGRSNFRWKELAKVVLDLEICLSNRPLTYVEDDVELSVLTPNLMITGEWCVLRDERNDSTEEEEMKRRAKHVLRSMYCEASSLEALDGEVYESPQRKT